MELFRESIGTCFLGLFSKFYDKQLYRESSGDDLKIPRKNTSWLFSNYTQKTMP